MDVDEWYLQVSIDVDVILENYPITNAVRNLLVYKTILQCSTIIIILNDSVDEQ